MKPTIQQQMFAQMQNKQLFEQAQGYAYEYADNALARNVFPSEQALANLQHLDQPLPSTLSNASDIISELHNIGSPATVSQIAGRYFGLVNGGVVPVALAAKWLSDFWDQNTPLYATSPINSVLEAVTERWLKELLGLPPKTVAGFVSGSSMAILCGLAAARYRIFHNKGWDINKKGYIGAPKIRLIAGIQAHGTVVKAASLLGFGTDNIEWVDADEQGKIIVDQIPALDDSCLLVLQAGNVNSGAFDDFSRICQQANKAGAWIHIDGAFGLWASASASLKHLTAGIEHAHSFSVDGHKTLNTPYDSGIVLCSDKDALINALQASGAYIIYGEQRDGMLYTPEMSRRARVIELWSVIKYLGSQGIDELILGLHQHARQFAQELTQANFTVLNEVVFNQVLVTLNAELTAEEEKQRLNAMTQHISESGECWVGTSVWRGRTVIRVSVCSWATTAEDVTRSVNAFINARKRLDNEAAS